MNISIIYEDNDLLVIDKPAGVTVNKSETTIHEMTIQDWAEGYLKVTQVPQLSREEKDKARGTRSAFVATSAKEADTFDTLDAFRSRAGIVHRLDKETSGILLIAKKIETFEDLQKQFKERTVKKTYTSLAHGKISPAEGEISVPVGRLPWNRKQFGIVPGGRESLTKYKTISNFIHSASSGRKSQISNEQFTLVELYPQSGRTHQIRVHLKYIGHPVFADYLYAGRKTARKDRLILPRVFLHAAKITFIHPGTGEEVSFESVLPQELAKTLQALTVV